MLTSPLVFISGLNIPIIRVTTGMYIEATLFAVGETTCVLTKGICQRYIIKKYARKMMIHNPNNIIFIEICLKYITDRLYIASTYITLVL